MGKVSTIEVKTLNKLLKSSDQELKDFATRRLEELNNPQIMIVKMLEDPEAYRIAKMQIAKKDNIIKHQVKTLRKAARIGGIYKAPKDMLTEHNFSSKNTNGLTVFHTAATYGHLDQIPKEFLSAANLLADNQSASHIAAAAGNLDQIPKEIFTNENLKIENNEGESILMIAARKGHLNQLPSALLTAQNLLHVVTKGTSCLQITAECGHLDQIPKDIYTKKNIGIPNKAGTTILPYAAFYGQLSCIPKQLLTEELLTTMTAGAPGLPQSQGFTSAVIVAAARGKLDQLLGVELSDKIIDIVGKEWHLKNKSVCKELQKAREFPFSQHEVELF